MKRLTIAFLFSLFVTAGVMAQDYNVGIGLRSGFGTGLTVKHFFEGQKAVEGILDSRWNGFCITGLYEIHNTPFAIDELSWYYGAGAHLGFWNGKHYRDYHNDENYTILGIDGVVGLEYKFKEIPFVIGIDWKPMINLTGSSGFYGDGGAISIRYFF